MTVTTLPTIGHTERVLSLASFKDRHSGETIVVCGCGESLNLLTHPERFITIGVNDVGRQFHPDYLVVVNPPTQFSGDRFRYVEASQARYLFTQLDLPVPHPNMVKFRLGTYGGTDCFGDDVLHYTQNSPYVALCLAAYMGAKRIGLIGVDFTDHHFFARTGTHHLARNLGAIDEQYRRLGDALRARGVEVVNLSQTSRLAAFPNIGLEAFEAATRSDQGSQAPKPPRVLFVHYRFLAGGDIFRRGLTNAASALGLTDAHAWWDDANLSETITAFRADLLFVVHGRRFARALGDRCRDYNTAVWLLDEPYEVDDTSSWSGFFKTVFVNDPGTLDRHSNAHYLPVCYDPVLHADAGCERGYRVGFVGGYNQTRERYLSALAREGLLSYVIGGPWRDPAVAKVCLASNTPPDQVATLYQQTQLVVNVFRDIHHYNRSATPGRSMNPRLYEALACGAAVVSEARPEVAEVFPEIPTFGNPEQLLATAHELLSNQSQRAEIIARSRQRLHGHTYTARLAAALKLALPNVTRGLAEAQVARAEIGLNGSRPSRVARSAGTYLLEAPGPALSPSETPSRMPTRNLIYHVWPVKGSTWRWNVEQLLKRIDIFNGRRIISVVHDARSEEPEAVQQMLEGHGCEFQVAPNDPRGEAAPFPTLLDKVKSTDTNELTFYGHAKGVKYGPNPPEPVRKWVHALYRVNLDDWIATKGQLHRYPMTGAFKMCGRFATHRYLGDWHYSGTFFWFRNSEVFSRDFQRVPDFYGGVEAWPGILFSAQEAGCLFLDGVRELAYQERFWRLTGDTALARWESQLRVVPPPPDLARPLPYEGHEWPRLEQSPREFDWWVGILLEAGARSLLSIGAGQGGVEWHVARKFREQGRDIEIASVDVCDRPELAQTLDNARSKFGQEIRFFPGDSTSQSVRERLRGHYDAVFIDSDHSFRGIASDFQFALSRNPRVIGLHDIVDSDWHVAARCCVSRLWSELVHNYRTDERKSNDWGGIGVVWAEERNPGSRAGPDWRPDAPSEGVVGEGSRPGMGDPPSRGDSERC